MNSNFMFFIRFMFSCQMSKKRERRPIWSWTPLKANCPGRAVWEVLSTLTRRAGTAAGIPPSSEGVAFRLQLGPH